MGFVAQIGLCNVNIGCERMMPMASNESDFWWEHGECAGRGLMQGLTPVLLQSHTRPISEPHRAALAQALSLCNSRFCAAKGTDSFKPGVRLW